jgi:nucleoside-diphosphate-sugar epimerase
MKKIFLTGQSGFVGSNFINSFSKQYHFKFYDRNDELAISENIVLHFAGKAHDLKNTLNKSEYYEVNTELTKKIFDAFLESKASVFITLSSVKAVTDKVLGKLYEDVTPDPITHYGKSKLLAEQYIISHSIPEGKRVYILRPCMIHGPGNKGNLNLLYNIISKGFPWPLGAFKNYRSYLSIDNLCFIISELIENEDISSGIYNIADDIPLTTNEVVNLIAESKGKKIKFIYLNQSFVFVISRLCNLLKLPFNTERLQKLTESYVVSNSKINKAIGKRLPVSSREGLLKTFKSFSINV